MIEPGDDVDDDFEDEDSAAEAPADPTGRMPPIKPNPKQYDIRRRIEDILEQRRLREEFGNIDP